MDEKIQQHFCYLAKAEEIASPDYNPNDFIKLAFTISEVIVSAVSVVGNLFVIFVYFYESKLRRRNNYYIISMAIADLLIGGVAVPVVVLESVCLPKNIFFCHLNLYLLISLLSISALCVTAVSVDRYWAVIHPLSYSTTMTGQIIKRIIIGCWTVGAIVGIFPVALRGGKDYTGRCSFTEVVHMSYFTFHSIFTGVTVTLVVCYINIRIYIVILRSKSLPSQTATTETLAQKLELKAAKKLSAIVLLYMLCTTPLFAINFLQFCCISRSSVNPFMVDAFVVLTHCWAAVSPYMFAFHLTDFRTAFKRLVIRRNSDLNSSSSGKSSKRTGDTSSQTSKQNVEMENIDIPVS